MAGIDRHTRTLFFTTSPRTPMKMVPEIKLLAEEFSGVKWTRNSKLQKSFMLRLFEQEFFMSSKPPKDPAFSARDRITRAPKALGFVNLEPVVELTPAGHELVYGDMPSEALLRQLVKFQLPSPYHPLASGSDQDFFVRPYLEILRLVRHFGSLSFDELMLFGLQLTNYKRFDEIVDKIDAFRVRKAQNKGQYRKFIAIEKERVVREVYASEISSGDISTREAREKTLAKFVKTKTSTLRDYADACFRYLRATEVVSISQRGHSLSIAPDRVRDVDYLLDTMPREPRFIDREELYKDYLFDAETPKLLTDDPVKLTAKIHAINPTVEIDGLSVIELKSIEHGLRQKAKEAVLNETIAEIKDCKQYDDIQATFDGIVSSKYYDNPLVFEWNAWRAMTMIDGGNIIPNFNLDDNGEPISTAAGNTPDILCDYGDFSVLVEVTLQSGQKQYDNEGEPVARHLGKVKQDSGREAFCLFVAPKISKASVSFFYSLHHINIEHYGGKAVIVPMELAVYRKMLEDSYKVDYVPNANHIRAIFEKSKEVAAHAENENVWYEQIRDYALNWLDA
ncbi:AlwI family type II restriction endonuclease [Olsenella sp. DSM 107455]|uniref:AlwI family type II restriction endonuclease n=1 Tax=Thermophilibacter gallinarum TaxID=2779357 RepID=A0ABR9QT07_9ACTN|nr:AlwI family type II restriction endonuclease [Thermophilibacter gallinarum]MBE5024201.1 AlwI family type II restriction endonuclease [Thermophilibacter gallinarum]